MKGRTQIDSLSVAEKARFGEWVDKWVKIGLSTDPANRPEAERAILDCYRLSGLAEPKTIVWVQSPLVLAFAAPIAAEILKKHGGKPVRSAVGSAVDSAVGSAVYSAVGSAVGSAVRSAVGSAVDSAVYSAVDSAVGSAVGSAWSNYLGGQFWISWQAFESYFDEVLGLMHPKLEHARAYRRAQASCCWWWPHIHFVMICDRPEQINRDEQGRLHSETKQSIRFRDGWCLWHWHGVAVDKELIEQPTTITVDRIEKETNAEIRRIAMERYGLSRYLLNSGAKELHRDDWGTLYQKEVPNDVPLTMVQCTNASREPDGTFKSYYLRVPPDIKRAKEAIAWTFGQSENEYNPKIQT